MKKLFLTALSAVALTAGAQQLQNADFNGTWGDCQPYRGAGKTTKKVGTQPEGWVISHVAGANLFGSTFTGSTVVGEKLTIDEGNFAVHLKNTPNPIAASQIVPAYLTLGTTFSTSTGSLEITNKDGGTFGGIKFNNRPDAVEFSYRRSVGKDDIPATVVAYLWKGEWQQAEVPISISISGSAPTETMIDRERNVLGLATAQGGTVTTSEGTELIASLQESITEVQSDWVKQTYEFNYLNTEAAPEKFNIIFAANDYFDAETVKADNTLDIDNVRLVYYHALQSITYNGTEVTIPEGETAIDLSSERYDESKALTYVKKGVGATVEPPVYDPATATLTIEVRGNDYSEQNTESVTTYTVQFEQAAPAATLASLSISGEAYSELQPDTYAYTLPYVYNPGIVFEAVAAENCELVTDDEGKAPVYDNAAKTVTIGVKNVDGEVSNYVFAFTEAVASVESGSYTGSLSVTLTNAEDQATSTPLANAVIEITGNSNGTVNLALNDFSFAGIPVGDIFVPNVPVENNQAVATKTIYLTDFDEDGNAIESFGSMLGALPVKIDANLLSTDNKEISASIDILTDANPMLAMMFKGIHVDFVPFAIDAKEPLTDGYAGRSYYPYIEVTGRVTKDAAKYLQINNSYVNSDGEQRDLPMTHVDLSTARVDADVTLVDVMTGAPAANNTLIYVAEGTGIEGDNVVTDNTAETLKLTDGIAFAAPKEFTAKTVSYDRVFATGEAEGTSIVMPFAINSLQFIGQICQFTGVNNGTLNFETVTGKLEANTPCLVLGTAMNPFANMANVQVAATPKEEMAVAFDAYKYLGAYSAQEVTAEGDVACYEYMNKDFAKQTENTLHPFRALMVSTATDAPEVVKVLVDGQIVGIVGVNTNDVTVDVYTVDGKLVRRGVKAATSLQGLPHGVYVVGGNKVIK